MSAFRKRKFDYGRWQTQRQRFGNLPGEPPAAFIAQPISNVLSNILSGIKPQDEDTWQYEIAQEWQELAGSKYAPHTRPGKMIDATLYIYVKHSIWLAELSGSEKKDVLYRLQKRFGSKRIRAIKVQLDPDG